MLCNGSEHGEEGGVGGAVDVKLEHNVKNININFSFRSLILKLFSLLKIRLFVPKLCFLVHYAYT